MQYRPLNILIADDDEEDLELIEEAILGLEPKTELHKVMNGKAAVEYLGSLADHQLPSLIILDYNMPELNGSEVLLMLCGERRYENVPKVILSTSNAPLYMHECLSNGASAYFVKPNTKKELDTLAEEMLGLALLS